MLLYNDYEILEELLFSLICKRIMPKIIHLRGRNLRSVTGFTTIEIEDFNRLKLLVQV